MKCWNKELSVCPTGPGAKYQNVSRADSLEGGNDGLVQIWPQFAVENVTGGEAVLRASDLIWFTPSSESGFSSVNVFKPDVMEATGLRGLHLFAEQFAQLAK
jgi:hypothetical protein